MKIMCEFSPSAPAFIRGGWGRAFQHSGHQFFFWNPDKQNTFDAFSEIEPDIFLGTTYNTNRAVVKCLTSRPHLKVGLFASAWGPLVDGLNREKYPIVYVTDEEKKILSELKRLTGKPDFVFIHVTDKYLEPTMGGWNTIGITPIGILNGYDTLLYANAAAKPELKCDIGYVGGKWPYKSRNIDKFLLPLCHPSTGYNIKIFGTGDWGVPQYLGICSDEDNRDLFASATICPNISEPHSTDLGFDCVERLFKIMGAGGFCVSDHVEEMRELFTEEELITQSTPKDFRDELRYYTVHPERRDPFIKRGRAAVLANHTYHHRVAKMFTQWGLETEATKCLDKLKELR